MMHRSRIKQKFAERRPAFGTTLHLSEPALYEMVASLGFDAIWIDLEHHGHSVERAADLMRAARAGGPTDIIARPAKGEFMRMGRLLEAGAHGIMYPRCDNADEAAEVVRWAKFAPLGERGCDAAGADSDYMAHPLPDYIRGANENTFLIIQLEDPRAVEHAEAIIALDGVDMLMLGPGDMSVLIGEPGRIDHPTVVAARERIAAAATAAGKGWAVTSPSTEFSREMAARGASLIFQGSDVPFLRQAFSKLHGQVQAIASAHSGTSLAAGAD
jgi:4-hydroxy-2-oxoheptanedioate aldolase